MELIENPHIILASLSPRRKELMNKYFKNVKIVSLNTEEKTLKTKPEEIVMDLARQKMGNLNEEYLDDVVVSADTIVYFNGKVYGKPHTNEVAYKFLKELESNTHSVYTGVCVSYKGHVEIFYEKSLVKFNQMSDDEIKKYILECKPLDKAGAYGIQDKQVVKSYDGDYDNIVGLPIKRLVKVIKDMEKEYEEC